jgi:hypothetical protein
MPSSRIVCACLLAAIAVACAVSANARTTTVEPSGKPLALLAGLKPPHEIKAAAHARTADRRIKKGAAKLAARRHHAMVAADSAAADSAAQPAPPGAAPANVGPVADATLPTDIAAASPPEPAPPGNDSNPRAVAVDGQTVQVAAPDRANAIDLAADDSPGGAPAAAPGDPAHGTPAAQTVLAAPVHRDASQDADEVGSASWIAQVLAALGGAAAAGTVAWFLIGSGPVRIYG